MKANHVSVHDKRKFLDYLLKKHQFKVTGSVAFLNYFERLDDKVLQNVHFVAEGVHECPFGICMTTSTYNSGQSRFYFQSPRTKRIYDPYKVMEFLDQYRSNLSGAKFYFQVNMPNAMQIPEFASVVVDNPHYKAARTSFDKEVNQLLEEIGRKAEMERLYKKIDEALDVKDEALFMQLTESVKQMNANEGELR